MKLRRLVAVAVLLMVCGVIFYKSGSAAPPAKGTETKEAESIAVRYARAQLRVAELTLQKAQAMNKRLPGTLVSGMVSQFSDEVELSKLRLQAAMSSSEVDPLQACLQRAELSVRTAETKLKKAAETNQQVPNTVSPVDLERLRAGIEVARLRLEYGRSVVSASPDAKLQWQIELLNDELARVKEQTYLLGQNRISQF